MRIALVTCRNIPEPDHDERSVVEALRVAGADADVLAWDDPEAPFADCDLVILRSTWNYYEHLDPFLAWVERTDRLRNPKPIVRWNAKKTYLLDLHDAGVAIVPTVHVARGDSYALRSAPWDDVVVKPTVSARSFRTARFRKDDPDGQRFLDELVFDRDAMIQKWMPTVDTYGERSLVWIDGEITHAIRKSPRFRDDVEHVSDVVPITTDERSFAEKVIAAAPPADLLYARIDMIRDEDGTHRVMELELIEPSLFFEQSPRALARFVKACIARARG